MHRKCIRTQVNTDRTGDLILYVAVEATATYKIMDSLARELEFRKWLLRSRKP